MVNPTLLHTVTQFFVDLGSNSFQIPDCSKKIAIRTMHIKQKWKQMITSFFLLESVCVCVGGGGENKMIVPNLLVKCNSTT